MARVYRDEGTPPPDQLLNSAELGRVLGVSQRQVRRVARERRNDFPQPKRLARGKYKWLWSEVKAWIDSRSGPSPITSKKVIKIRRANSKKYGREIDV